MACNSCGKRKKACDNKEFTKAVVEINNPETNVLIRKVVVPASLGDDITNPPVVGKYCNVVLFYEANWHVYLYSSDGIPTLISDNGDVDFDRIQNRPWYNGAPMTSDTRIPKVPTAVSELSNDRNYQTASQVSNTVSNAVAAEANIRQGADETLRNDIDAEVLARQNAITTLTNKINRDVMYDLEMSTSAQAVSFKEDKVNVVTGATSTEIDTIPTASSTTAGIITAAEYSTLVDSEEKIEALLNGAVAITGLPSTPTQAELTTTWKNATGRDTLINRASIFDVDNQLVWTYYTNVDTWESAPSGQVSVSQFGNGTPGIITGSTIDGNVSANLDGTGTVSGWTTVKNDIATNTAAIATKANITDIPTVNNATLTIQKNGSNVATFTANSATNATANITVPTIKPENFFTNSATDSDKGNPLYFEDTTNEKLVNIMLEGDTDQDTYSGKNLLNVSSSYTVSSSDIFKTVPISARSGVSYRVSCTDITTNGSGTCRIGFNNAGGSNVGTVFLTSSAKTQNVTLTGDAVSVYIYSDSNYSTSQSATTTYTNLMISEASSSPDYEPYVGGIVSPNPDYPQDVQVVTGEQTVLISGKNLFNSYKVSGNTVGTLTIEQDGTIVLSNNPNSNGYCRFFGVPLKSLAPCLVAGNTYYLSLTGENLIRTNIYLQGSFSAWDNGTSHTLTQDELDGDIVIYGGYQSTSKFKLMITKVLDNVYEPYEDQEYTINLGKNLLNLTTFVKGRVDNGVIGYAEGTDSFSWTDDSITFTTNTAYRGIASALIPVHPNTTYFISAENSISRLTDYYDKSGNWISRATVNPFVTPANCYFVRVSYQSSTAGTFTVTKPQLEIGTSRTTFAPYKTPIELCKIGGYQDYIYKDGDDWYIHKDIGKVIFDGTENWSYSGGNLTIARTTIGAKGATADLYSDVAKANYNYGTNNNECYIDNSNVIFSKMVVNGSQISAATDWETYLNSSPSVFYFPIATATNTKITDNDLITQLDTLWYGAYSYDNVTWIFSQSNGVDLPFIIDATVVENSLAGVNYLIDNKQDILTAGDNITIANNVISASVPTVNNATLTIQKNGVNVATFTANSSTNATANITVPTITMTNVDPGEGSPLAANNFIAVYEA